MDAAEFNTTIFQPCRAWFVTATKAAIPVTSQSDVLMLAIAGQESGWSDRVQSGAGPAHGFWQFEKGGGVAGVMGRYPNFVLAMAAKTGVITEVTAAQVWLAMALPQGDGLSFGMARLLLWTDPTPLPAVGDEDDGWDYYQSLWRPGAPSRSRWATVYPEAMAALSLTGAGT